MMTSPFDCGAPAAAVQLSRFIRMLHAKSRQSRRT
jgi:hypothetical protein